MVGQIELWLAQPRPEILHYDHYIWKSWRYKHRNLVLFVVYLTLLISCMGTRVLVHSVCEDDLLTHFLCRMMEETSLEGSIPDEFFNIPQLQIV